MNTGLSFNAFFQGILVSRFKYRDRASIVKDILETITTDPNGKTKTNIMRAANLNFEQVNKYLDFLVTCDAIRAASPLNGQELARYKLTQKGFQFLRNTAVWDLVMESYRHRLI